MERFHQIFEVYPQYGVVVCRLHQYAVIPTQVYSHLQALHTSITPSQRRDVQRYVAEMRDIAH